MQEIDIKVLQQSDTPVAKFTLSIFTSMLNNGICCLQAKRSHVNGQRIEWRLTGKLTGEISQLDIPDSAFRPILAHIGFLVGCGPYTGHALFSIKWLNTGKMRHHRFSMFLCNEPAMDIWITIYLYCIDGVWPMREHENDTDG